MSDDHVIDRFPPATSDAVLPDGSHLDADPGDVLSRGPDGPRVWLPLPDVADELGIEVGKVRRLLQEQALIGLRRAVGGGGVGQAGERKVMSVPAELIKDGAPLPDLQGTLIVLADAGFSDEQALRWLFTDDDYPGSPVDALRSQRGKTEVRRRAQALAL